MSNRYTWHQICKLYADEHGKSEGTIDSRMEFLDTLLHLKNISSKGVSIEDMTANNSKYTYYTEEHRKIINAWLDEFDHKFINIFRLKDQHEGTYVIYDIYQTTEGSYEVTKYFKSFKKRMQRLYEKIKDPELKGMVLYLYNGFDMFDKTTLEMSKDYSESILKSFEEIIQSADLTLRHQLRCIAENDWLLWLEKIESHYDLEEQPHVRKKIKRNS